MAKKQAEKSKAPRNPAHVKALALTHWGRRDVQPSSIAPEVASILASAPAPATDPAWVAETAPGGPMSKPARKSAPRKRARR